MPTVAVTPKLYCNQLALEEGLDPVGHAGSFATAMVIEAPLPWKSNMYSEAGVLPQQVIDLYTVRLERYRAGLGYPYALFIVAPDPNYSRPGYRRIMAYDHPTERFATFRKREYCVSEDQFGELIWALAEAPDHLPQYEQFRDVIHDSTREILVCTHGSVDVACAKFGVPLYKYLRKHHAKNDVRVWRVSHFGGHVFAPTLVDMPHGHYWAYVESEQADQIINRTCNPRDLYRHYRGWAGLDDSFLQTAERELWMHYGWDWFNLPKSGQVISATPDVENATAATVQLDYTLPHYAGQKSYVADVEVNQNITTPHSSASAETYAYKQYVVKNSQFS